MSNFPNTDTPASSVQPTDSYEDPPRPLKRQRISNYLPDPWSTPTTSRPDGIAARRNLGCAIIDRAHGFPYSRRLEAHISCVNALKFSSGEGRFLASGGDDKTICLWDFYQEDVMSPSYLLKGPRGNIFSIEFSVNNKFLFCGGSSSIVMKYDVASLGSKVEPFVSYTANQVYADHEDSVRSITCHPTQDEIFMTVSEDGTIRRHDVRQPDRSQNEQESILMNHDMTGAQYHPRLEHLFITSDSGGNVLLWDARMSYTKKNMEGVVQKYHTRLTKLSERHLCSPESSSIVFDKEGTKFAVTFLHYLPTIYSLSDPNPVAVLSAETLPDGSPIPEGQKSYFNTCTMKHGAFGGPGMDEDSLYAAGSDNFRGYIWKIPRLQELMAQRQVFSAEEWLQSDSERIAFTDSKSGSKVLPVEIPTPLCWLTGHESIVNTIAFHPHFLHVVTAGVEKRIVLHSPTPSSPCTQNLALSPTHVRQLTDETREQDSAAHSIAMLGIHVTPADTEGEEMMTISLFDHIIREEGDVDVFVARNLKSSDSSSDSEEEEEWTNYSSDVEDMLSGE